MAFTLGNIGSLFESDEDKRKKALQGGMSAVTDKGALQNVLEQRAVAQLTGNPNIDTSQQSRVANKDLKDGGGKAVELEASDFDKGTDWGKVLENVGRLSELQPKKGPMGHGSQVSSQVLSGAGRLGTGLTLKDILKYRP